MTESDPWFKTSAFLLHLLLLFPAIQQRHQNCCYISQLKSNNINQRYSKENTVFFLFYKIDQIPTRKTSKEGPDIVLSAYMPCTYMIIIGQLFIKTKRKIYKKKRENACLKWQKDPSLADNFIPLTYTQLNYSFEAKFINSCTFQVFI